MIEAIIAENQIKNAANDIALARTRPSQERCFEIWGDRLCQAKENPEAPRKMMVQLELECQLAEIALQAAADAEERFYDEVQQMSAD